MSFLHPLLASEREEGEEALFVNGRLGSFRRLFTAGREERGPLGVSRNGGLKAIDKSLAPVSLLLRLREGQAII